MVTEAIKPSVKVKSVLGFHYQGETVELKVPEEDLFKIAHMLNALLQSQGINSELVFTKK